MFKKNLLTTKQTRQQQFEFDIFKKEQNTEDDASCIEEGQAKISYNFICQDGSLKSGYGFGKLSMPVSEEDLDTEVEMNVLGEEVAFIWKMKWYDKGRDSNRHYLFFYNDLNNVCFDNVFAKRPPEPFIILTDFTTTPFIINYRSGKKDTILLSSKDGTLVQIIDGGVAQTGTAPAIVSCCNHYGKLFAITATARGSLIYSGEDIFTWSDVGTQDLDFSDERGDLNKIISFNDYVYLFRDFGITKLSDYGNEDEFAISHCYKASAYIQPKTIVEMGDSVYFLEGEKLKTFNGVSVSDVPIKALSLLKGQDNRTATAEVFDGKYYLACRANFGDDQVIGCEGAEGGYENNMLLVYDIEKKSVDIMRGADIRQLLALTNGLKSKLIACFYNDHKGKIGQLNKDGKLFGERLSAVWRSGKLDFSLPTKRKTIKSFLISSLSDCQIKFTSEEGEKICSVKGGVENQTIKTNLSGKSFEIEISSLAEDDYITDFVLTVLV